MQDQSLATCFTMCDLPAAITVYHKVTCQILQNHVWIFNISVYELNKPLLFLQLARLVYYMIEGNGGEKGGLFAGHPCKDQDPETVVGGLLFVLGCRCHHGMEDRSEGSTDGGALGCRDGYETMTAMKWEERERLFCGDFCLTGAPSVPPVKSGSLRGSQVDSHSALNIIGPQSF